MTLPPLPEPSAGSLLRPGMPKEKVYTADQLREYAQTAVLAERAACAQIAERHSTCKNDTPNVIAVAIRAQGAE